MRWIDTQDRLPLEDNNVYVVSVTRGNYTFKTTAYFDFNTKEWYYSDKGERSELITNNVNAWVENLGVYVR